jgi:predicted membrane protein
MSLITRLFIKSGLIFFLIALLIGVSSQAEMLNFDGITPLFWHALMVGWITQIIMGVSMWMFPGRVKEESFQNQKWGWLTFGFLNVGLGFRLIAEPFVNTSDTELWNILLVISALFQFIAVAAYVIEIWPRVMSKRQRRKKRKDGV